MHAPKMLAHSKTKSLLSPLNISFEIIATHDFFFFFQRDQMTITVAFEFVRENNYNAPFSSTDFKLKMLALKTCYGNALASTTHFV